MNTNRVGVLALALVPVVITAFACGHRPDDEGMQHLNNLTVLVGEKDRGYLGVSVDEVTPKLSRKKNLKVEEGVYVSDVTTNSPADDAGIKTGDVIVEFDGTKVYDNDDLVSEVRRTKPGTEVQIGVNRNGQKQNLKATIGRLPRERRTYSFNVPPIPRMRIAPRFSWSNSSVSYGLTIEELNRQLGEYFGAPNGRGLLVKSVERGSEAEKSGFKAGDVIVKVGNDAVDDVGEFMEILREYKDGDKATIEVVRKGSTQKLSLTIDEGHEGDLSYRMHNDDDDDVIIDLMDPDEGVHLRREADRMKREGEKLKRNLEHMKEQLHDGMIDLRERIRKEVDRVRMSIEV
jgi:C-terminal processing protease CtpA/Prc